MIPKQWFSHTSELLCAQFYISDIILVDPVSCKVAQDQRKTYSVGLIISKYEEYSNNIASTNWKMERI